MKEENYEDIFKDHIITPLEVGEHTQVYQFRKANSGMYGFNLIFSDNLIYANGDIGPFVVAPGYGRNGLAFLRGSLKSEGYFLSKVPYEFKDALVEYSYDEVKSNMKEMLGHEYITQEQHDEVVNSWELGDYGGQGAIAKYYELCFENSIEEPWPPTVMRVHTKIMLAGLKVFLEKLDGKN